MKVVKKKLNKGITKSRLFRETLKIVMTKIKIAKKKLNKGVAKFKIVKKKN